MGLQRHNFGLAIICGLPVISAIFVGLRFLARWRRGLRVGWDDWLLCFASVLSFAFIAPSVLYFRLRSMGYHSWEIVRTADELSNPDRGLLYAIYLSSNLLSIPILPLSKASIILLLLRVGRILKSVRLFLKAVFVFNALTALVPWLVLIFICKPGDDLNSLDPRIFGNLRCFDRDQQGKILFGVNVANLVTDVLVFPIPFFIMRELMNTTWRSKLTILVTFASSIGVTIFSALKIPFTETDRINIYDPSDKSYSLNYCITHAEVNVGIIVACLPTLRGLISRKKFDGRETYPTGGPTFRPSYSARPSYSYHISAKSGVHFSKRRSDTEQGDKDPNRNIVAFEIPEDGSGSSVELVIQGESSNGRYEQRNVGREHHTFNPTLPLPPVVYSGGS